MENEIKKIIYVGDPMCSWCYGFGPELDKLKAAYPDVEMQLILGGLRPHGTETMGKLGGFLREHWDHVKEASGLEFSYDILEQEDFIYDTEPSCRAVETARSLKPEIALDFYHAVQKAFYAESKDTRYVDLFLEIAKDFELDTEKFAERYESAEMKHKTAENFEMAASMGIRGFPSLVLQKGEQYFLLSRGYQKAEAMMPNIEQVFA